MTATFVANPAGLATVLRSPSGPVFRRTMIYAEKVKRATVAQIDGEFVRTFLAPTIVKRPGLDSRGMYVDIGSARTRTRPHPIDGNPLLVFFWPKAGRVVALRHVNHPGSNFGPYLRKRLIAAVVLTSGQI